MADKKKFFASLRYIVPEDLEFFLEESASEGMILDHLGESSLFYFDFTEGAPEKTKYVADVTGLSKALYMEMLINKGWEYMGKVMNCYLWRQTYSGNKRPDDFADKKGIRNHCLKMGITFAVLALILIAIYVMMIMILVTEGKAGNYSHITGYCLAMGIQLPIVLYLIWAAFKLLKFWNENKR
ncbi:MAG: DUF2812 domain-containing protein [Lachnospiraceae bacterium]|nr:DUF2812 domain-containing protein [Lachnospiraceae bacterium]